jgi:SPP1 family predicted phage head-tail adaptor
MIGYLKNRVQVKKLLKLPNGRGGFETSEIDLGEKWAAIMPLSHREITQYMQLDKNIDARIVMRKDPEIDSDCIIIFRNIRYEVDSMLDRLDFSDFIDLLAQGEKIHG